MGVAGSDLASVTRECEESPGHSERRERNRDEVRAFEAVVDGTRRHVGEMSETWRQTRRNVHQLCESRHIGERPTGQRCQSCRSCIRLVRQLFSVWNISMIAPSEVSALGWRPR